jgi:hypothetical protein
VQQAPHPAAHAGQVSQPSAQPTQFDPQSGAAGAAQPLTSPPAQQVLPGLAQQSVTVPQQAAQSPAHPARLAQPSAAPVPQQLEQSAA